jgi:hypothetical protein
MSPLNLPAGHCWRVPSSVPARLPGGSGGATGPSCWRSNSRRDATAVWLVRECQRTLTELAHRVAPRDL